MDIDVIADESLANFATRVGRSVDQLGQDNPALQLALADLPRKPNVEANLTAEGFATLDVALQEVEVGKLEKFTDVEARVPGATRAQLRLFNEEVERGLSSPIFSARFIKSPANQGVTEIYVQAHIVVTPLAGPPLPDAPEPLLNLDNPSRRWLTYESLFNQRPYRKTNQACAMGLYRMPVPRLRIFLREDVDKATCEALVAAFFPDLTVDWIQGLSAAEWKWKVRRPVIGLSSPAKLAASRGSNVLYLRAYAILPYNYIDNTLSSHAIGTKKKAALGATLAQIKPTWRFWKTASRSCIAQLVRVKDAGKAWQPIAKTPFAWPYPVNADVPELEVGANERGVDLAAQAQLDQSFDHAAVANSFSVKTGVVWVGVKNQQGAHKDALEENCIVACLRSDLIVERDKADGRDPKTDPDLIVQTELLSMTERDLTDPAAFGDGVQVRDLSVLDATKIYIPPISIPFLDLGMRSLQRRFACAGDQAWRDFWRDAYAKAIGRAKAILLLRYGLQMGSPNAQNWLLEFNPGPAPSFTGRVVIRDVGDAYLHREVIWARYGGVGLPPQTYDDRKRLKEVDSKIIQYECDELASKWDYYPQETGSIYEQQYGPPGTRFLWHRFSTLSKGSSVAVPSPMGTDPDAYKKGWQQVLAAMGEWGIAHARAYTDYIEATLATDFHIDWAAAPDPARYLALTDNDQAGADRCYKEDLNWEDHKTTGVSVAVHDFLASSDGQDAIKAL